MLNEIEELNNRNSIIILRIKNYLCIISRDRRCFLILKELINGSRNCKKLTPKFIKSLLGLWPWAARIKTHLVKVELEFTETRDIIETLLDFINEVSSLYYSYDNYNRFDLKWYYTVSL